MRVVITASVVLIFSSAAVKAASKTTINFSWKHFTLDTAFKGARSNEEDKEDEDMLVLLIDGQFLHKSIEHCQPNTNLVHGLTLHPGLLCLNSSVVVGCPSFILGGVTTQYASTPCWGGEEEEKVPTFVRV